MLQAFLKDLRERRIYIGRMKSAKLYLMIVAIAAIASNLPANGQMGSFAPTGDMTIARSGHRATLLADGRVLVTGGSGDNSAELYDPATHTFALTGRMNAVRAGHSATLLADGRVLIAAGWNTTTAEIYDPTTGTFTPTGSLLEDQGGHTATLLPNGKVLIAGGERSAPPWPTAARPELYDPESGTFSFARDYSEGGTLYVAGGPIWPTANLLRDGRVLIVGENPPEIYDPATQTFTTTGRLIEYPYGMDWHGATTLHDGTVLVTGGNDDDTCGGFDFAEIYDPSSGTFSVVGPMTVPRDIHTATLLPDGTVLIAGGGEGWCGSSTHDTAELYIPSTHSFVAAGRMSISRTSHTATLLNDGTVLIAGGDSYWPHGVANSAELYRPIDSRTGRIRLRR
jgi:WD40 repeat protein